MSSVTFSSLLSNVWAIFLIVLFFGGSIFVHELGHFLAARRRGVKVTRFSIGFGPAIFSWQGKDGVDYRISWLPLGGFVALPQLADMPAIEGESDPAAIAALPPISYGTKMIVFAAGAFFNVVFAFILACILWAAGQTVAEQDLTTRIGIARPEVETAAGKTAVGPAYAAGLREGDVILEVDGKKVDSFSDIAQLVALGGGRDIKARPEVNITYERSGQRSTVQVFPELIGSEKIRDIGIEPATQVTIEAVQPHTVADAAGLKSGDIIISLDGHSVSYSAYISDYLRQTAGRPISLSVLRDSQARTFNLQPSKVVDSETKKEVFRLGVIVRGAITIKTVRIPPWTQLADNALWAWRSIASLLNPHSDIGLSKLSGPIGMVERVHTYAKLDFKLVLAFVILMNVNLAIFNLLPIPVLDGGQMLFATIGKLRGRALPFNFVATTQGIFVVLILSMMAYVTIFGDLRRIMQASPSDIQAAETAKPSAAGK